MELLMNLPWNNYVSIVLAKIGEITPRVFGAMVVLIIGWIIINQLIRGIHQAFEKLNFDEALEGFIESLISIALKIVLFITVAGMLGIQMTTFVAMFGAAGLAIGLALQGSLANFAGGVLILVFKPFKIGDYIEAQGFNGTVQKIEILYTLLKTPSNEIVVIPNGELSNNPMMNYSKKGTRRVDMIFGIGYGDDIDKAEKILKDLIKKEKTVLDTPEPTFFVHELADSSVNLQVRAFAKTDDSWTLPYTMNRKVKKAFDAAGISIPYPQRDVHLHTIK